MADRPVWQFDLVPRWLAYCGLPQTLGPTRWAVFWRLVAIDWQTLPLTTRRSGRQQARFSFRQEELIQSTGLSERTVQRALEELKETRLISYYRPGTSRLWSRVEISVSALVALYRYVGPRMLRAHGGVHGLRAKQLPENGIQVYGRGGDAARVTWEQLYAAQQWAEQETPDPPEPAEVARICGIHAAGESQ